MSSELHGTTLGYCGFDASPMLADPRSTGGRDIKVTNVHEQSHRDLINCTLYGYVLGRLNDLAQLKPPPDEQPQKQRDQFAARMWNTAEGSATAHEMMSADRTRSPEQMLELLNGLPDEYQRALRPFIPIVAAITSLPGPLDLVFRSSMIEAVSEIAADWSVSTGGMIPVDFWQLINQLRAGPAPDAVLERVLQAVATTTMTRCMQAWERSREQLPKDPSLLQVVRGLVGELKTAILEKLGVDSAGKGVLNDRQRIEAIQAIEPSLMAEFPTLIRRQWTAERIFDQVVRVQPREPGFLLPDETLPPAELFERYVEVSQLPDFEKYVNEFFLDPKSQTYSLICRPIDSRGNTVDLGAPYLICRNGPETLVRQLDDSDIPHIWMTFGIALTAPPGFYNSDLVRSLKTPVYLNVPEFSWDHARQIAGVIDGPSDVGLYTTPPELGLWMCTIKKGNITVFGITPPNFESVHAFESEPHRGPVTEDTSLAIIFMVVMRTSQKHTIQPGPQ